MIYVFIVIKFLFVIFKPTKIPKKNEAKTFTIKMLLKGTTFFFTKLFLINILTINPQVLPTKI